MGVMTLRQILAGALVVIAATARADDMTTYAALTGRCTAVVVLDAVTDPSRCANQVVNIEFPSGRFGFMFVLNRRGDAAPVVFSFLGDGARQLHPDGDTAIQPIDRVYVTVQGSTDDLAAAGSCRFTNRHQGTPARVACSADSDRGRFSGEFIGDGKAPATSLLR
jgi:hypothetical protein